MYIVKGGWQISFVDTSAIFKQKCTLKFLICEGGDVRIGIGNHVRSLTPSDPRMAVIPYIVETNPPDYKNGMLCGFLKDQVILARSRAELAQRTGRRYQSLSTEPLIAKTFVGPPVNLLIEFGASEWSKVEDAGNRLFSDSVKMALEFAASDIRSTGP
jgi:hypothetical protein